jgi:hypothetical protein
MLCEGSLRVLVQKADAFSWGASDPKRGCVLRVFFLPAAACPLTSPTRDAEGLLSRGNDRRHFELRRLCHVPQKGDDPRASPAPNCRPRTRRLRSRWVCTQRAGPALWQSARATRVRGRRLLVQDTWYRHLAIADRLIVEARRRLADQKTHIADLEEHGEDTRTATALLRLLEETLRLMQSHRATILQKLAGQPEPRPGAPADGF